MRPIFIFLLVTGMGSGALHAQDNDDPLAEKRDTFSFDLAGTVRRVSHSLYDSVELVDERPDRGNIGWLDNQTYYGLKVCLRAPLEQELKQLVSQLTDSTAAPTTLLVEMKRFLTYNDRSGYHLLLRCRLFSGSRGLYRELAFIDTGFTLYASMRSKNLPKFMAMVNGALCGIFSPMLTRMVDHTGDVYTRSDIPFVDGIKKRKLPLYQQDVLPNGIYKNFVSFQRLEPDVDRPDTSSVAVRPEGTYAFVYKGNAYISHDDAFTPLFKKDGEYYIIGEVKVASPGTDAALDLTSFALTAASMLRLPLVQVWGLTAKKKFFFLLDYQTGRFVPFKPVDGARVSAWAPEPIEKLQ